MATHELLKESDWNSDMAICDRINADPRITPIVLKHLKPRLDHKRPGVGLTALALLSSIIDNCPKARHYVDKAYLDFLVSTLPKAIREPLKKHFIGGGPVTDIEQLARCDRLLSLVRRWSETFKKDPELEAFHQCFCGLSLQGVKFPDPRKEALPPVNAPPPSAGAQATERKGDVAASSSSASASARSGAAASGAKTPVPGANFKNPDCRAAMQAAAMLTEVLHESDPRLDLRENDLVQSVFVENINPYRERFTSKITAGVITNEVEMMEHIEANDALVAVTELYKGLVTGKVQRKKKEVAPALTTFVAAPAFAPASAMPYSALGPNSVSEFPRAQPGADGKVPAVHVAPTATTTPTAATAPAGGASGAATEKPKKKSVTSTTPTRSAATATATATPAASLSPEDEFLALALASASAPASGSGSSSATTSAPASFGGVPSAHTSMAPPPVAGPSSGRRPSLSGASIPVLSKPNEGSAKQARRLSNSPAVAPTSTPATSQQSQQSQNLTDLSFLMASSPTNSATSPFSSASSAASDPIERILSQASTAQTAQMQAMQQQQQQQAAAAMAAMGGGAQAMYMPGYVMGMAPMYPGAMMTPAQMTPMMMQQYQMQQLQLQQQQQFLLQQQQQQQQHQQQQPQFSNIWAQHSTASSFGLAPPPPGADEAAGKKGAKTKTPKSSTGKVSAATTTTTTSTAGSSAEAVPEDDPFLALASGR